MAARIVTACCLTSLSVALPNVRNSPGAMQRVGAADPPGSGRPNDQIRFACTARMPAERSSCMRVRGGTAPAPQEATGSADGITTQELVAGGVLFGATAIQSHPEMGSNSLWLTVLTMLVVIRVFNPTGALSVAAFLHSTLRLHDEIKAVLCCGPLATMLVALTSCTTAVRAALLALFCWATLLSLALMGALREVVLPLLTGFSPVLTSSDRLHDADSRRITIEPLFAINHPAAPRLSPQALFAATVAAALAAGSVLAHADAMALALAMTAAQALKLINLPLLQLPAAAAVLCVVAAARSVAFAAGGTAAPGRGSAWAAFILRFSPWAPGIGAGLAHQAGAVAVATLVKQWAGVAVSAADAVPLAVFVASSLTTKASETLVWTTRANTPYGMYVRMCACVRACVRACVHACTQGNVCMHACMHACIRMCHTHIHSDRQTDRQTYRLTAREGRWRAGGGTDTGFQLGN